MFYKYVVEIFPTTFYGIIYEKLKKSYHFVTVK